MHCETFGIHEVGDHLLWLGKVNKIEESELFFFP